MQIIGIYLNEADERIRKNLKNDGWYPFGDFPNCHEAFFDDKGEMRFDKDKCDKIIREINENQKFINELYNLNRLTNVDNKSENQEPPKININCLVGKNGSGKSSLVALEYRILNNLSCRIKTFLPGINQEHKLLWAYGFNAELYYELEGKLYCIRIYNNNEFILDKAYFDPNDFIIPDGKKYEEIKEKRWNEYWYEIKNNIADKVKLYRLVSLSDEKNNYEEVLSLFDDDIDNIENNSKFAKLSESIFYTIVSNYSLYSNIAVSDSFRDKSENWIGSIYHKNDSYFTPITLLPYKGLSDIFVPSNELKLARERINTLAILTYIENKNDFIDGFIPKKIDYSIIYCEDYAKKIFRKFDNLVVEPDEELKLYVRSLWDGFKEKIFSDVNKLENDKELEGYLNDIIKENTLKYLTYKTIRMCFNYEKYYKKFKYKYDNLNLYYRSDDKEYCKQYLKDIVENIISDKDKTDFMNLKIKQCLEFLKVKNIKFYFKDKDMPLKKDTKCEIDIEKSRLDFLNELLCGKKLNYDNVFLNSLPDFFYKEVSYEKIVDKEMNDEIGSKYNEKQRTISSLSSGESQLLQNLSYIVYHIKNIASVQEDAEERERISYKNVNLIFDEAELYYHPEYQRKFIFEILSLLKRSNVGEKISSINITIITHSPYILSDIPKSNITCLKNSEVFKEGMGDTLSANIYDLLKNQFFLESTIGENSKRKIKSFLEEYEKYNKEGEKFALDGALYDFYRNFISCLGEQYFKETLTNMLEKMQGINFIERLKSEYGKKIENLKLLEESQKGKK